MSTDNESSLQTACLLILAVIGVAFALSVLKPVMIPFVLAIFATLALTSISDVLMRRFNWPRGLALAVTGLVGIVVLGLIVLTVSASVRQLIDNADSYQERFQQLTDWVMAQLPADVRESVETEGGEALVSQLPGNAVQSALLGTTNAILGILSQLAVVIIFTAFLTLGGSGARVRSRGTWAQIERRIKQYLAAKVAVSALVGVLCGITYAALGVELALVFGLFHFLLNFIPNVGSFIALVLPLPVVVMSPDMSNATIILAFAIPLVINMGVGNVLEPKIMGDTLQLHPVTILLALIFWGTLWGIPGMFLAVPLTSAVSLLLEKLHRTHRIAALMAGDTSDFFEADDPPPPEPEPEPEPEPLPPPEKARVEEPVDNVPVEQ